MSTHIGASAEPVLSFYISFFSFYFCFYLPMGYPSRPHPHCPVEASRSSGIFFPRFWRFVADGSTVVSVADRAFQRLKSVTSQGDFHARAATSLPAVLAAGPSNQSSRRSHVPMSTATTTEPSTGQHTTSRPTNQPTSTNTPTHLQERNAASRLRATMAAVRLSFTWLGVRKTLAPEQRTTAARAFQADRDLLTASKLILDTKNPAYRAVAAVRSEASSYWPGKMAEPAVLGEEAANSDYRSTDC